MQEAGGGRREAGGGMVWQRRERGLRSSDPGSLHLSIIPSFHHSIIPPFHHSIIPSFLVCRPQLAVQMNGTGAD
jgi:hypothetical protein